MVLDKLGSALSDALRKIAGKGFIDKDVVEEFIRDLQRALLQADVDVKLVFSLSNRIRDKVLKEKPSAGITAKEHMIKTVYDELVNFLGKEQGSVKLEKQKILLVGLFGSGKCVHPDSRIPLATGEVKTIEEIYNESNSPEIKLDDGFVKKNITDLNVFSFDNETLKIAEGKVTVLWKLQKTDPLISLNLDNGNHHEITVTPEHPFFVLDSGKIRMVRADELKINDTIAAPKLLRFLGQKIDYRYELFKNDKNFALIDQRLAADIKSKILEKFATLREFYDVSGLKGSYCRFTVNLKRSYLPIEFLDKVRSCGITFEVPDKIDIVKFTKGNCSKPINFPLVMSSEMAEFLGYVYADGNAYKNYIQITSEDDEIVERIRCLALNLFSIRVKVGMDKRYKKLFRIQLNSSTLLELLNYIFGLPVGRKSRIIKIPRILFRSDNSITKKFIGAYFDCDGYASDTSRGIEIVTASEQMSSDLRVLLLRFGVFSSISKKLVKDVPYYRIFIRANNAEIFSNEIPSILTKKMSRLKAYFAMGKGQTYGKCELLHVGNLLKEVREHFGLSVGKIQKHLSSYGIYEREGVISKNSLKKFLGCINNCKNNWIDLLKAGKDEILYSDVQKRLDVNKPWLNATIFRLEQLGLISTYRNSSLKLKITNNGISKLDSISEFDSSKLKLLENLADADLSWVSVKMIVKCDSVKYVYDLTVESYHNFVANEVIVHNTTTSAKLAKFFIRKGLKPALVGCDTFRPAAQEQIIQLGDQIGVPVHAKGSDPSKIASEAIKKFPDKDIIIFDSAGRNALDAGLAEELRKLRDAIKPDETFLVIPADIGQVAGRQSEEFSKLVGITGVIVTKMDGTAKGGAALSSCAIVNAPIKFIGAGENVDALEPYDPKRFVSRLIGYGDLQTLIEKAEEIKSPELMKSAENMVSGKFSLQDFYEQIESIRKMGPLKQVMQMIPGMRLPENILDVQEGHMAKWKVAMDSMTREEKQDPSVLDQPRIKRIALGSGLREDDVKELLKHYQNTKKMMKMVGGKNLKRGNFSALAKQFGLKM